MIRVASCMGGWCVRRQRCAYYRPGLEDEDPDDHLCEAGTFDAYHPAPLQAIPQIRGVQVAQRDEELT